MKKLVFAAAAAVAMSASAELKIGTVEMLTLVRNHSTYESNKSLMAETEKDYSKKLDALKSELEGIQEEGQKLAEQYRNPMLAAKAKADLEKQLMDIQKKLAEGQQRLRTKAMNSQQELQDLEGRLLKATTEDIRKKLNAYAEKEKFDLIADATTLPFAKKSLDVTDAILKEMGVDPATAKRASADASNTTKKK